MKRFRFIWSVAFAFCLLFATTSACAQTAAGKKYTPQVGQDGKDAIWAPTPQVLVDAMLDIANVTSSDYVIDLGSGDGRLVIAAAKLGATALGIEYNPDLVEFARRAASEAGVNERATFEKADIFKSDFSKATVITLFLPPDINLKLRPKILNMKPGTRIVSTPLIWETGNLIRPQIPRSTAQTGIPPISRHAAQTGISAISGLFRRKYMESGSLTTGKSALIRNFRISPEP